MKTVTTQIIIFLCISVAAFGQKRLDGIVIDQESNAPLWGASVQIQGSQKGVTTDAKGTFSFLNVFLNQVISVSYVGFEAVQVPVGQANRIALKRSAFLQDEVIVKATRADENSAMAFTTVQAADLKKSNLGQDMPMLLNFQPSIVSTSDAGAGIGYTGIRIRGSDATRVNVTVNGIPINDSESQGTYWVNMPDMASSVNSVQIQRGVGTSTNGAGAFGGSVNMQTNTFEQNAYGEINVSGGSFGTLKTTIKAGSGLMGGKFTVDGRVSRIVSDGFIDRATSNLQSAYFSAAYFAKKSFFRVNYFTGREKTYQSWYGTPESRISGSKADMQAYIDRNYLSTAESTNLLTSGRTYNYYTYSNQTDNYSQDHLQLLTNHQLSAVWDLDLNGHYTYGRGYYEEFKPNADLANYGLKSFKTDLVRQKWLDNDFYGSTFALRYSGSKFAKLTFGGAWNRYVGRHFGEIISGKNLSANLVGYEYYRSRSQKTDLNVYVKANLALATHWNAYVDLQYRGVGHKMAGIADKLQDISQTWSYHFFNPKLGLTYTMNELTKIYASYSLGSREPSRQDFVDNPSTTPRPEFLRDLELGFHRNASRYSYQLNGYFMSYSDQLILTGALNSVGEAIRTNAPESYRMGVEASLNVQLSSRLIWQGNITLSQNKIQNFTEKLVDYLDYSTVSVVHGTTDIAYSPSLIAGNILTFTRGKFETSLLSKYVGKQFLDNTSNAERSLPAYMTQDVRFGYGFTPKIRATLLLNNVLNTTYTSNGYTYSYLYGGDLTTENFHYPQAGFNFLLGLSIRL